MFGLQCFCVFHQANEQSQQIELNAGFFQKCHFVRRSAVAGCKQQLNNGQDDGLRPFVNGVAGNFLDIPTILVENFIEIIRFLQNGNFTIMHKL